MAGKNVFTATEYPRTQETPLAFFGDGAQIPRATLQGIRAAFDREAVNIDWRPGDVALLDNMRVAHGRRSFTGERRVFTALLDPYSVQEECLQ